MLNNFVKSAAFKLVKLPYSIPIDFLVRKPTDNDRQGRSSGSASWRLARGEIEEENPSFVWEINEADIIDNDITIRYSASLDQYDYISGNSIIRKIKKWSKGVYKHSGIFRKEEKDWKMVYLCRRGRYRLKKK